PGDIYTSPDVGSVYTLLYSNGGVSGQITYQGQALAEGDMLTLADGNLYQISYQANGGQGVTLTRIDNPAPPPTPGAAPQGSTLDVAGAAGDDVVRLERGGSALRVYANFLPGGVPSQTLPAADVRAIREAERSETHAC